jgi:hypothetical protein
MAAEQRWKPHQLTDSELNREILEHQQLLEQPLSQLQREDLETALQAFLLEREERHTARQAALAREVKSYPESSISDFQGRSAFVQRDRTIAT